MYNIDYSIVHARARGTYFYKIKFLRLKENSYNLQKFCTLKITRCTVVFKQVVIQNPLIPYAKFILSYQVFDLETFHLFRLPKIHFITKEQKLDLKGYIRYIVGIRL